MQQFTRAQGKDICAMGREEFVARAPAFMGDILWEHLEILQKGMYIFYSRICIIKSPIIAKEVKSTKYDKFRK